MTSSDDRPWPVYVGIDGSATALEACAWVARYAADENIPVTLVHAIPNTEWFPGSTAGSDGRELFEAFRSTGRDILVEAESVVHRTASSVDVETVLTRRPIAPFMATISKWASLVVVGSSSSDGTVLGGETVRICDGAQSAVMVFRTPTAESKNGALPVEVGVDCSDRAEAVLLTAFEYARSLRAPLAVSHVLQAPSGPHADSVDWSALKVEQGRWLFEVVEQLGEKFDDVETSVRATVGSAARHLRERSVHAQLLVVGRRGRCRGDRTGFGGTERASSCGLPRARRPLNGSVHETLGVRQADRRRATGGVPISQCGGQSDASSALPRIITAAMAAPITSSPAHISIAVWKPSENASAAE